MIETDETKRIRVQTEVKVRRDGHSANGKTHARGKFRLRRKRRPAVDAFGAAPGDP